MISFRHIINYKVLKHNWLWSDDFIVLDIS